MKKSKMFSDGLTNTAMVSPPKDVQALAKNIIELLENEQTF
jgi:hypothetical protein